MSGLTWVLRDTTHLIQTIVIGLLQMLDHLNQVCWRKEKKSKACRAADRQISAAGIKSFRSDVVHPGHPTRLSLSCLKLITRSLFVVLAVPTKSSMFDVSY